MVPKGTKFANLILGGSGVLCVVVLVYLIYRYSWTQQRTFATLAGLLVYYGVPALVAVLCFAALRLPPSHKINAAVLVISTVVSVYAGETLMNVWFSLPSVREAESMKAYKALRPDFDTRSKLEVRDDLREKGIVAYPTASIRHLFEPQPDGSSKSKLVGTDILPLGWISNHLTLFCNESGGYVFYESDEHGFHNPRGLWKSRRADIVAVGDSYVHGQCVPSDKNFVAVIRQHHPATLNLGWAGNGPLLMLATLKEYGVIVRPRVALWFYYESNDLKDAGHEQTIPVLRRYLQGNFTQGLIERQAEIDRALMTYLDGVQQPSAISQRLAELAEMLGEPREFPRRIQGIIRLTELRERLGLVYGRPGGNYPSEGSGRLQKVEMDLLQKSLVEAEQTVRGWGGTLYFVYLPDWSRYGTPHRAVKSRDRVLQMARMLGLRVIDIHEVFKAQPDPLALFPLRMPNHYNETGHRLVAEQVLRSIARR
jgi:hypothetical protein